MKYLIRKLYWTIKSWCVLEQTKEFFITHVQRDKDCITLYTGKDWRYAHHLTMSLEDYFKLKPEVGGKLLLRVDSKTKDSYRFAVRWGDILCLEKCSGSTFDALESLVLVSPSLTLEPHPARLIGSIKDPVLCNKYRLRSISNLPLRPGENIGVYRIVPTDNGFWDCLCD